MKQTMLWMLGLCMAILPTGPQAMGNTTPAVNAASVDEVAVNAMPADAVVDETTKSAVCDTIFMTWTAEAGKEKTFYFAGPESENYTFVVDWGDGTKEEVVDVKDEEYPGSSLFLTAVRHAYASDGIYVVKLYGMVSQAMLKALYCVSVQVTSLDVSRSADLYFLECVSNSLTSLNVSRNAGLTYLRCFQNRLSVLDVSHNPLLAYLECSGNSLTSLDVSQNTALEILGCGSNQLTSLDVSQNIALTALGCGSNQLTSLDVSQNTALASLGCKNNQLSSLNLSRNTALVGLDCSNNQLSSLDISKNTALVGLDCSNNQLSSLDISRNTVLTQLECYNNQLSSLDVSRNTALEELYCHNNPLAALNLSKNANLSTLRWYGSREVVLDEDNGLDMNVLAGVEVERVKDVTGGHIEGSRMIFEANSVMYEYSTGCQNQDSVVVFILTASEPLAPSDVQSGDMLFMTWAPLEDQVKVFWFQGTASEDFIIDWGDGEKEVVTGQGISDDFYDPMQESAMVNGICMRHQYKLDGSRIEYSVKIIGQSPDARIEKFHCTPDHANNVRLLDVRNCPKLKELYCYNTWMAVWDLRLNEELEKTKLSSLSQAVSYSSLRLGHHPFLTYLSVRGRLQVLDVSRSPLLTYLECDGNQLTSLDVSRNTALTHLDCDGNQLTSLDVSRNTALTHLDCDNNQLASLDVSRNTALTYLACGHNQLTSLDVSLNTALRKLYCANNQLTSLDVFQNTALTELFCYNNQLSSLDLSQNTALEWLYCSNNQLSSLDVSQNTALFILHCAKNRLTSLDLSRNLTLADLDFGEDLLTVDLDADNSFDLSTLPGMDVSRIGSVTGGRLEGSRLIFESDSVTYRYATHFPGDASLGFDSVWFTLTVAEPEEPTDPTDAVCDTIFMTWTAEAGVEMWFAFSGTDGGSFLLDWGDSRDTVVVYQRNDAGNDEWNVIGHIYDKSGSYDVTVSATDPEMRLTQFLCGYREEDLGVTSLNVSTCSALEYLYCVNNLLTSLDVSGCTAMKSLNCADNRLTVLDVGQNAVLDWLDCCNNQLASLDVSANTALTYLACGNNPLRSLDVSHNTALEYLACNSNGLTSLDVRHNTALEELRCEYNLLSSLDVSLNTKLRSMRCDHNSREVNLDENNSLDLSTLPNMDVERIGRLSGGRIEGTRLFFEANDVRYRYATGCHSGNASLDSAMFTLNAKELPMPPTYTTCDTIVLVWEVKAGEELKFSLIVTEAGYFTVDWGDGQSDSVKGFGNNSGPIVKHRYDSDGTYTVTIYSGKPEYKFTYFSAQETITFLDISRSMQLTSLHCNKNLLSSLDLSRNANLMDFSCGPEPRKVVLDEEDGFDLNALPGMDVARIGRVAGGHLEGSRLIFETYEAKYHYVTGYKGAAFGLDTVEFTLFASELAIDATVYDTLVFTCRAEDWEMAMLSLGFSDTNTYFNLLGESLEGYFLKVEIDGEIRAMWGKHRIGGIFSLSMKELCANELYNDNEIHRVMLTTVMPGIRLLHFDYSGLSSVDNDLITLDVSRCPSLMGLYCNDNKLTSIDISKNTELRWLQCANNSRIVDLAADNGFSLDSLPGMDVSRIGSVTGGRLEGSRMIFEGERVVYCYATHFPGDASRGFDTVEFTLMASRPLTPPMDTVSMPMFNPAGGEVDSGTMVSVFCATEGATIHYTVNGDVPTGTSLVYEGCILIDKAMTIRAVAVKEGFVSSSVAEAVFTIRLSPVDTSDMPSDTLMPENGAGWIWLASAGEEKEVVFKGTGKGFRVDWGDCSTSDAKGGADGLASMATGADGAASASKDSEKALTHRYAEEGVYTVTLAPLSQNGRLTDLDVSDERVLALAFGDASMLEALDCSDNLLTELALSEATKLKDLDCSGNRLAALDLSGCAALQEADFSDNLLTSVSLPTHASLKDVDGEGNRMRLSSLYGQLSGRVKNASYGFDPQSDSVTVAENAVLDLASEMTIGGRATTYTLSDAATRRPAPASDYAAEGGLFRFFKPGARYLLTLRNANVTDYEKGRAATPVAFTYHVYVSGVGNEDLASDEAAAAPWAYVQGRTIHLTEPAGGAGLGEVEAFTAVGQRVYRGHDRAFTVPTAGVYVLRAADGRRCKVMVR